MVESSTDLWDIMEAEKKTNESSWDTICEKCEKIKINLESRIEFILHEQYSFVQTCHYLV